MKPNDTEISQPDTKTSKRPYISDTQPGMSTPNAMAKAKAKLIIIINNYTIINVEVGRFSPAIGPCLLVSLNCAAAASLEACKKG